MTGSVVLTLTRDIAASPSRVFDAWLDPAIAPHFLFATPDGEMTRVEIDARVGGCALIVEQRPQGEAEHHLLFENIARPVRLVFKFRACIAGVGKEEGAWTRVTIDFASVGTGTRLTLTHEMAPEWAAHEQRTRDGWTMILANLAHQRENDHG